MKKSQKSAIAVRVGADKLWDLGFEGQHIAVAIIDSGLKKKFKHERNVIEAVDFSGHHRVRHRGNIHGTGMTEAFLAIAPKAEVGIFKVTDDNGVPYQNATLEALQHCIDVFPKYRIVNMSLSFPPNNCPDQCELCQLVEKAYKRGILVTIAAGNKGHTEGVNTITCPGNANWAFTSIAVLPKSQNDFLKNMGWFKKVIWEVTGKMKKHYGTSLSSVYSAGCAALVFSAFPKLTADTYRHFAHSVMNEKRKQGIQLLRVDDVYNELLRIKNFSENTGALVTKPGALKPVLEQFW